MRYRHFVAVGCVLVYGLSVNTSIPPISEYKKQLGGVIHELNQKEEWIATANEEILSIEASIKESDTEIASVAQEITDLESNIGRLEGRIDVLETDQAAYQKKIDALTDSVSWHLHSEYRLQKNHWLKNLLNYDEPKKRARFIRYHQYVVRSKSKFD